MNFEPSRSRRPYSKKKEGIGKDQKTYASYGSMP